MSAGAAPADAVSSRSYRSIVLGNVFTVFNVILAGFGGLTVAFGHPEDALFVGILVTNSAIGIIQEVRAKRALDRLAALVAPTATVLLLARVDDAASAVSRARSGRVGDRPALPRDVVPACPARRSEPGGLRAGRQAAHRAGRALRRAT